MRYSPATEPMLAALSPKDGKIALEVGRKLAKVSIKKMLDRTAAKRRKRTDSACCAVTGYPGQHWSDRDSQASH